MRNKPAAGAAFACFHADPERRIEYFAANTLDEYQQGRIEICGNSLVMFSWQRQDLDTSMSELN